MRVAAAVAMALSATAPAADGRPLASAPAAPSAAAFATPASITLAAPVAGSCISSPFGPRRLWVPIAGHQHPGVDLPAPIGAPVRAAAAGRVVGISRRGLGGLFVMLRHAGGLETLYAHLGTVTPALAEGRTEVAAGETLGRVGRTGKSFGPHVYFAVMRDGRAIDPEPLLALARCH